MNERINLIIRLAELAKSYNWKNDLVSDLGRFERESLATLYFYDCMLNGDGDILEISDIEREVLGLSLEDNYCLITTSESGFVFADYYQTEDQAESHKVWDDYGESDEVMPDSEF